MTHALVIMAKRPQPGKVKTRLVESGALNETAAAEVARAMLRAIARRLPDYGQLWLAVAPDRQGDAMRDELGLDIPPNRIVDQGEGNLGSRLARLWNELADAGAEAVTFFGMDSPDLPAEHLRAVIDASQSADGAWVGPTYDGGYWAIGGSQPYPGLLEDIDWGTSVVYDQTCDRALRCGLALKTLPAWHDIDEFDDLLALCERLNDHAMNADEPTLRDLRRDLDRVISSAGEAS